MKSKWYNPFSWTPFEDKRGIQQLIDEELNKARIERFDVRLELEAAIGREAVLTKRILRLEAEQHTYAEQFITDNAGL